MGVLVWGLAALLSVEDCSPADGLEVACAEPEFVVFGEEELPLPVPDASSSYKQLEALSANTTIDNGAFIQITSVSNPGHQDQGWSIYDNGPGEEGQAAVLSNCLRNAISHLKLPGSWCFTGRTTACPTDGNRPISPEHTAHKILPAPQTGSVGS